MPRTGAGADRAREHARRRLLRMHREGRPGRAPRRSPARSRAAQSQCSSRYQHEPGTQPRTQPGGKPTTQPAGESAVNGLQQQGSACKRGRQRSRLAATRRPCPRLAQDGRGATRTADEAGCTQQERGKEVELSRRTSQSRKAQGGMHVAPSPAAQATEFTVQGTGHGGAGGRSVIREAV